MHLFYGDRCSPLSVWVRDWTPVPFPVGDEKAVFGRAFGGRVLLPELGERLATHTDAPPFGFYFFSSSRAINARCTSSGPSAIRKVRMAAKSSAKGKSEETPAPPWI